MPARLLTTLLLLLALSTPKASASAARGCLDGIFVKDGKVSAYGWAGGASPDDRLISLDIYIGSAPILNQPFTATPPRPDVVTVTGRNDWLDSGWKLDAKLGARLKSGMYPVRVVAHFANSGAIDLTPSVPALQQVQVLQKPPSARRFAWLFAVAIVACLVLENLLPNARAVKVAAWLLVAIVFCSLAYRQYHFTDTYAVNVMFLDQWDFYAPIFSGGNLWQVFDHQAGPTRWGAGLVVTEALAKLSGWNSRWDAFGVSFLVTGAAALALLVTARCGVRPGAAWATVPLLFFNIRQYESFIGTAILGHGGMPVLLLMGYCLAWFISSRAWRLVTLSLLTFLLIFTGFGLFVGLITPLLFTVELIQAIKAGEKPRALAVSVALCSVFISWLLFAHGYLMNPVAPGFKFPWDKPVEYFYFMALMLANFHGIRGQGAPQIIAGFCMVLGLVAICCWHAKAILTAGVENKRRSVVLFSLSAFSLLYMANAAVGRISIGLYAASAPRYVTLVSVAGFAFFLQVASMRSARTAGLLGVAYGLVLAAGTWQLAQAEMANVYWFHDGRLAWKQAYLKTGDALEADRLSNFQVYPDPGKITPCLAYLRAHHLNLFNGSSK